MSLAKLCIGLAAAPPVADVPRLDQGPLGKGEPKLPCPGTEVSDPGIEPDVALVPDCDNDWAPGLDQGLD
jgi:hypothetical protein